MSFTIQEPEFSAQYIIGREALRGEAEAVRSKVREEGGERIILIT